MVGVVRFKAAVGLEDLEEQGKCHHGQYAVGIHGDELRRDYLEIAGVLSRSVVGHAPVLLVAGLVDAQDKLPGTQRIAGDRQSALPQVVSKGRKRMSQRSGPIDYEGKRKL